MGGLLLATLGWVFGNPPTAAPDEPAHHVKAVAAGRGDLEGEPAPSEFLEETFTEEQQRLLSRTFRSFSIPRDMSFRGSLPCFAFDPGVTADCMSDDRPQDAGAQSVSIVGGYPPFLYVPVGLVMRLGESREAALRLGRLSFAGLSVGLLWLAAWLLGSDGVAGRRYRLVGLMVAVTPAVVFLSSSLSATGPEVTSGIAVTAGVLRLSRPGSGRAPAGVWWAVGGAALVLGLSRPLGPLWLVLEAGLLVGLLGGRGARRLVREGGRPAVLALAVAAVGMAVTAAWVVAAELNPPVQWSQLPEAAGAVVARAGDLVKEGLGVFGWLDTYLPSIVYVALLAGMGVIGLAALVLGDGRQRVVLLATVATVAFVTLAVGALIEENELGLQSRYVLPVASALPLLAAEIVARSRRSAALPWTGRAFVAAGALAVAIHPLAWLVNARRYAVGADGPLWFPPVSQWSPPLGWWAWTAVVVVAAVAQLAGLRLLVRPRG